MGNTPTKEKFGSIKSNSDKFRPGYYVNSTKVIYKGEVIPFLPNETSFEKLKYGYAKTNMNVYYKGKIIPGANPNTFTVLKGKFNFKNSAIGVDYINDIRRTYHKGKLN